MLTYWFAINIFMINISWTCDNQLFYTQNLTQTSNFNNRNILCKVYRNESILLLPYQPVHSDQIKLSFDNESCLTVIEMNLEVLCEIPVSNNFCLKPSKPLILMFCLSSDSIKGGCIVMKEEVFLLTFSEELVPTWD